MAPTLTLGDSLDAAPRDAVVGGDYSADFTFRKSAPDRSDLSRGQNYIPVVEAASYAFGVRARSVPVAPRKSLGIFARRASVADRIVGASLGDAVQPISLVGTQPQMGRVAARSEIAAMEHQRCVPFVTTIPLRKLDAVVKLVGYRVRRPIAALPIRLTVAVRSFRQSPRPAVARAFDIDLCPEVFWRIAATAQGNPSR